MLPEYMKIEIHGEKIGSVSPEQNKSRIIIKGQEYCFENAMVLPGLADAHLHFFGIGEAAQMPDFRNCKSEDEVLNALLRKPFQRGDWLVGFGWNQENFTSKKYPHKHIFDKAFPDIPVFLKRIDGHAALLNSYALELLGISESSPSPEGGKIEKDANGELTGILVDTAMDIAINRLPFYSEEQIRNIIGWSQEYLFSLGLTEVIDMDLEPRLIPYFKKFDYDGFLKMRVNAFVKSQNNEHKDSVKSPYFGNNFSIRGLKLYVDGALGSRGAALKSSYADDFGNTGLILMKKEEIVKRINEAISQELAVAVHSIGDKGAEIVLDAFNEVISSNPNAIQKFYEKRRELPLRLEHCQIISSDDFSKFASGLIGASIQPIHYTSDTTNMMAQKRLGETRMKDAYRWKSLKATNAKLLAGSDAPIESPDPFLGIRALTNENRPDEKTTLAEAFDAYTVNIQKSLGNYPARGIIKMGNDADLVIISGSQQVLCTISHGQIVFRNEARK